MEILGGLGLESKRGRSTFRSWASELGISGLSDMRSGNGSVRITCLASDPHFARHVVSVGNKAGVTTRWCPDVKIRRLSRHDTGGARQGVTYSVGCQVNCFI